MKMWFQKLRGAVGIGLTWAAGWFPVGAVTGAVTALLLDFPVGLVTRNYAVLFGALGFLGGAIFSLVLSLAERSHTFSQLKPRRIVVWGALGGLGLGALAVGAGILGAGATTLGAVMVGASTLLGAGSAAGTLAIARKEPSAQLKAKGDEVRSAGKLPPR